jgi:hypothetical protein
VVLVKRRVVDGRLLPYRRLIQAKVAREAGVSGAWVARPQQVASSGLPTLRRRPLDGLIASFVLSVVTAGVLGSQG